MHRDAGSHILYYAHGERYFTWEPSAMAPNLKDAPVTLVLAAEEALPARRSSDLVSHELEAPGHRRSRCNAQTYWSAGGEIAEAVHPNLRRKRERLSCGS